MFFATSLRAQTNAFDMYNSRSRTAIVLYERDSKGFWKKKENVNLTNTVYVNECYAFNKKTKELFVKNDNSNCVIQLNDNVAKYYKKYTNVPQLKDEELDAAIERVNRELEEKYASLNEKHQKAIKEAQEKAIQDSIRKAVEDSIRAEQKRLMASNYRKSHNWHWLPVKSGSLFCKICDKYVNTKDSIFCINISNDSIYWMDDEKGIMDMTYPLVHAAKIPNDMKKDPNYIYHNEIFGDSLQFAKPTNEEVAETYNMFAVTEYLNNIHKVAPNGVLLEWGWDNEYSSVSFNFEYLNTNKKTIKYIALHWVIKNDVGDVRKTGYFKGTGPVEEWNSGRWNWDHSSYYVAGDASIMNITKIVITYMDGTTVTIPKNKIVYG